MVDLPDHAVVFVNDEEVGVLERVGESARFVPAEAWAETPAGARTVLGQQFEEDPFAAHTARYGAPTWFEHLLPDAGGPLRDAVANSLGVAPGRSLALLLALGDDLPGAVRVAPLGSDESVTTIARRERNADVTHGEEGAVPLRVSLAGLQFKISARIGQRGIAVPARSGEGDWILKFADQRFPTLPLNEFRTMSWARAAGMDVPEVRLLAASDVMGIEHLVRGDSEWVFAIRRYDRGSSGRIHQEDFAQVLGIPPGDAKYTATNIDTMVKVVERISPLDVDELLSRIVFSVLSGNDDAHAKNWSLWYPSPTQPRLSPAYDLVATFEYFPQNDMSLKIAGARSFAQVDRARFRRLASRTGLDVARVDEIIVDAVRRQLQAWEEVREAEGVFPEFRELLDTRLEGLRLARECS